MAPPAGARFYLCLQFPPPWYFFRQVPKLTRGYLSRRDFSPEVIRRRVEETLVNHARNKELRVSQSQRARDIVETVYRINAMAIATEQVRLALRGRSEMVRVVAGDKIINRIVPPEKAGPLVTVINPTQIVSHMGVPEVAVVNGRTVELPSPVRDSVPGDVSAFVVDAGEGAKESGHTEAPPPPPKRRPGRPRKTDTPPEQIARDRATRNAHYATTEKVERQLRREMVKSHNRIVYAADAAPEQRLLTSTTESLPYEVPEKPPKP
jgi:hypothetical protein